MTTLRHKDEKKCTELICQTFKIIYLWFANNTRNHWICFTL